MKDTILMVEQGILAQLKRGSIIVFLIFAVCLAGVGPTVAAAKTNISANTSTSAKAKADVKARANAKNSIMDLAAEQMAVRELMRLETSAALHRARRQQASRQQPGGDISVAVASAQTGNLALVAIYGVGKKLLARVVQGSKTYVYMRGQVLPVGIQPRHSKSVFRLQGMSSGCVELRRNGDSRTLCLHPALLSGG